MRAIHITQGNYKNEVLESEKPVLIDFWASWCGPCKMLTPVIEELADEVTNAKICKVNVDEVPELAEQFHVMAIPTLVVIKNGAIIRHSAGLKRKAAILEMLNV